MSKKLWIILSTFLFLGFIFFSYLVAKETFTQFDFDTTVKIQDKLPLKLIEPFSTISLIGSVEFCLFFCLVLLVYLLARKHFLAFFGLFLLPIGLAIEVFGKVFVYHPGPPKFLHRTEIAFELPSFYVHTDFAYPSGHMLRLTFIAIFITFLLSRRLSLGFKLILFVSLSCFLILVGVSRVYLGEHWTSDVIGGFLLGSSLAILAGICLPTRRKSTPHLEETS